MSRVESLRAENKFKKTEIGEIPVDWGLVKLKDVLSLEYGEGLPERRREGNKYPVFGSNGIVGYHNNFLVHGPGIIIGRKGTIGSVTWSARNFWPIDTTYYVVTDKNRVSLKWLYYELILLNLNRLNAATGIPGLNRGVALNTKIPFIPLLEQKKIAQILSTVDDAIEKSKEIIEKEKQLKKGLMQELLTKGIKSLKSLGSRESKESGKKKKRKFKKTEIGEIPVEWSVAELGKVTNITMGQSPSSKECYDYENGLPFFQGKAEFGAKYPKILKWCNSPKKTAKEGDTLISVRAPVGDINIAPTECCIGRGLAAVRGTKADNAFIYFVMFSLQTALAKIGQGSTFEAINKNVLFKLKIPFPPPGEQNQIAEILSSVDDKIEKEIANKDSLEKLKKGLMQVLLTGKIRVHRVESL